MKSLLSSVASALGRLNRPLSIFGRNLAAALLRPQLALLPERGERWNRIYADLARELGEHEPHVVWVCKQARWDELRARIEALGYRATALGAPYHGRIIFKVEPATR